jgi:hypothetical protein
MHRTPCPGGIRTPLKPRRTALDPIAPREAMLVLIRHDAGLVKAVADTVLRLEPPALFGARAAPMWRAEDGAPSSIHQTLV